MLKALLRALFLQEKIKTTEAKAKEVAPLAEKYITKAKNGRLSDRRLLGRVLTEGVCRKLIAELAPRYKERRGGYTRIIKLEPRRRDGARMAIVELLK